MSKTKTETSLVFGGDAKYTNWGLKGCSHGMYSGGGYDYYVYGIQGIFNFIIDKRWGNYI
jgi:hypothetical protein